MTLPFSTFSYSASTLESILSGTVMLTNCTRASGPWEIFTEPTCSDSSWQSVIRPSLWCDEIALNQIFYTACSDKGHQICRLNVAKQKNSCPVLDSEFRNSETIPTNTIQHALRWARVLTCEELCSKPLSLSIFVKNTNQSATKDVWTFPKPLRFGHREMSWCRWSKESTEYLQALKGFFDDTKNVHNFVIVYKSS